MYKDTRTEQVECDEGVERGVGLRYETGDQPCEAFKHQRIKTGVEVTGVCNVCGRQKAMCFNCGSWHHEGGWSESCATPATRGSNNVTVYGSVKAKE